LQAASRVASVLGAARHVIIDIDLRQFGGSALTADIAAQLQSLTRQRRRVRLLLLH
jgi:hypothetical protein